MLHKTVTCKVNAAGKADGLQEGQYRALVSVFGNKDSYGDVVVPGAFEDSLKEWADSGDPIPVYWSHRMDDPFLNIGRVLEAKETGKGLEILAELDIDVPAAAQVYRLLKGRRVTQHSFSYDIVAGGYAERETDSGDSESYYELRKLRLYEVGPTPIGANQETELLAVKTATAHVAREVKAGRTLSAKDEAALREAHGTLGVLLSSLDTTDQEKANTGPDTPDEEPEPANSDSPSGLPEEEPEPAKSGDPKPLPAVNLAAQQFNIYAAEYLGGEGA
jgi:HK97 family phage prohead protease